MNIRTKLMLLTSLSSGLALVIAAVLIGVREYRGDHRALLEEATTQARITAASAAAAVAFSDEAAATRILQSLRPLDEVVAAQIISADGTSLAAVHFGRPDGDDRIEVSADVMLDERIGTVHLWVTTAGIAADLRSGALILLGVLAGAMAVSVISAAFLQRIVSRPYADLARTKSELEQALREAQAGARAKAEFLANMSHEIRTPMNGVIGMLDLVDTASLGGETRGMIDTARKAADSLLTIINDVLDFSKIDAGKLTLESIDVDLRALVEDVGTLFASQAVAKGVEITCAVHDDVPAVVAGDPTRLRQVLVNLVGNAVKFTERGEVFLGVQCAKPVQLDAPVMLQFLVSDTGIGISEEASRKLFQAFTQADGSTTRKYGGTGLGLAITRRLIEAMSGTVRVKSQLGKGTTFSLRIPMPVRQLKGAVARAELRGLKILIVDDNPTNRCVLEHYLASDGMQFESAASAADALNAARAAQQAGRAFDAVLLDYHMPEVDGLGFLRALRSEPAIAALDCIVLSSLGDRVPTADTLDVKAWLAKPVRRDLLRNTLGMVGAHVVPVPKPVAVAEASAQYPSARVLAVEDNEVNQKVILRVLRSFGIDAVLAPDGAQAVECARRAPFDLILMDCQMPVMDGYEATGRIHAFCSTPIVAMTANALIGDREKCLAAGMNDYLTKPIKREAVQAMLDKWLREPQRASTSALRESPRHWQDILDHAAPGILDRASLMQLAELMEEGFSDVIQAYLTDSQRQLDALRAASATADGVTLKRAAHTLKSSSASLGVVAVSRIAAALEAHAEAQPASPEVAQMIAALASAWEVMRPSLQAIAAAAGSDSAESGIRSTSRAFVKSVSQERVG